MKTSELTGSALDWAVAKCQGIELTGGRYNRLLVDGRISRGQEMMAPYKPSTDWAQGGVLIERERISTQTTENHWEADLTTSEGKFIQAEGSTPLVAAMRCYVASKFKETEND